MQMTEGAVRIKPSEHGADVELGGEKEKKIAGTFLHSGRIKILEEISCGQEPLCSPDPVRRTCGGRSQL